MDFNFICTHQYKEFSGLRESRDEFMHTDESSKRFRAQLTGGGPCQTSRCIDDSTVLQTQTLGAKAYMDILIKCFFP